MIDFSKFNNINSLTTYFSSDKNVNKSSLKVAGLMWILFVLNCSKHHCLSRTEGGYRCKSCKRNFSCLVGLSLRIPNSHLLSGLLLCISFLPTRRVFVVTY